MPERMVLGNLMIGLKSEIISTCLTRGSQSPSMRNSLPISPETSSRSCAQFGACAGWGRCPFSDKWGMSVPPFRHMGEDLSPSLWDMWKSQEPSSLHPLLSLFILKGREMQCLHFPVPVRGRGPRGQLELWKLPDQWQKVSQIPSLVCV